MVAPQKIDLPLPPGDVAGQKLDLILLPPFQDRFGHLEPIFTRHQRAAKLA